VVVDALEVEVQVLNNPQLASFIVCVESLANILTYLLPILAGVYSSFSESQLFCLFILLLFGQSSNNKHIKPGTTFLLLIEERVEVEVGGALNSVTSVYIWTVGRTREETCMV
jgi:hypothetical protein